MQGREAMQGLKGFRESRGFAAISDQKGIRVVKVPREISVPKVRLVL